MGKQARRERERDKGLQAANAYFRRAGIPTRPDRGAFRRLAAADPEWFRRFSEAEEASRDGGSPDAAPAKYALLYRDLDTALAEYAARSVVVGHPWLRWWSEGHPPAGRLLDAGCGAGVLTCAYALALPDAEVIGVDAVPEAVACAEELARRVGAANATFVVGDCAAPPPGREFDQIVAVTALGDAGLYPADRPGRDPFSAVTEVDGPGRDFTSPGIAALAERLGAGGSFLVFDRTPYAPQAVWLGAALLHAGVDLDLDLRRSGVETLTEEGEKITFTRFAGTRGGGGAPGPTTTGDLAAWLKAAAPPAYGAVWHDELRFEELKARGAELVWAAEVSYAPYSPVRERREVWADGTAVYGWVTTTLGLRELTRGRSPDTVVAEYAAYARERAASGLQVRRYGA